MRVKTYYTSTVDVAMQRARRDLGENALLLNSRPAGAESRHLGAYEVTFGVTDGEAEEPVSATAGQADPAGGRLNGVVQDLGRLCEEVERVKAAIARSGAFSIATASLVREPELAGLYWSLIEADFTAEDAQELVSAAARQQVRDTSGRLAVARLQSALREEIQKRIRVAPSLPAASHRSQTKVIALIGPPGAGKTTALVKLAVSMGLSSRRPMQFLSHDVFRVGASEQLRTYALILGVGFQSCDSLQALDQSMAEHRHKDWIWIDTPGLSPRDAEAGRELAAFLAAHPEIDVHLVLSAAMRTADLIHAAERYSAFRPDKLLLTHLDETESHGALFTIPLHLQKPLSFLSSGQRIPEDLEAATVEGVLSLVMQRIWSQQPRPEWLRTPAGRAVAGRAVAGRAVAGQ